MTMREWFDKYGESHQNPINKSIHWICVPSIFFSLVGLLSLIPIDLGSELLPPHLLDQLHGGTLLIIFGLIFFFRLSISITLGMFLVSMLILRAVTVVNASSFNGFMFYFTVFVVAWIGQFIGHKIEGAKPSFIDDLKFLLIGPAWLLSFIYDKLGIKY